MHVAILYETLSDIVREPSDKPRYWHRGSLATEVARRHLPCPIPARDHFGDGPCYHKRHDDAFDARVGKAIDSLIRRKVLYRTHGGQIVPYSVPIHVADLFGRREWQEQAVRYAEHDLAGARRQLDRIDARLKALGYESVTTDDGHFIVSPPPLASRRAAEQ